jgi:hypothetical protein
VTGALAGSDLGETWAKPFVMALFAKLLELLLPVVDYDQEMSKSLYPTSRYPSRANSVMGAAE